MNIRFTAASLVTDVLSGKSLSDSLPAALTQFKDTRDAALVQAIAYGVCRHYFYLAAVLEQLLEKPLKAKDLDVYALLLVGLYQLTEMRVPAYAAVGETVNAAKNLKKPWAKNFVNAVLRNYQRNAAAIAAELNHNPVASYTHPQWMISALQTAWPAQWQEILTANNQHPPLALRVNARYQSRADYLEKLNAANIPATAIAHTQHGLVLESAMDVLLLPGFAQGEVSVQDGAAQLAAELLMLGPNLRVLDACAAPGGKTAHIAESEPTLELIAIDKDAGRLQVVRENLQRLELNANCIQGDAANPAAWWDGKLFDRILLDAPCSASGVIRRHPDIKLLRRPEDIKAFAAEQLRLLSGLWPVLKIGGLLLYATCTVFPAENTAVLASFLAAHADAQVEPMTLAVGHPCEIGQQIFPGMHGMDGFYYALLRKC
ncbi:MAG: 16S rRNA (cytosine(967)-C(5))-methyltransferase RsmB [Pseudomonadota bacterium]